MKTFLILFLSSIAILLPAQPSNSPAPASDRISADVSPEAILATMRRVADWQLAHPSSSAQRYGEKAWTYGAFYAGLMALSGIDRTPKYHDAMVEKGKKFEWQPAPRVYHADDHCVCQSYLELYLMDRDPAMLAPTKDRFDYILSHPSTNSLDYEASGSGNRWSWCDALFMSPPAWALLAEATGDPRYLEFMDKEWRATSAFLYDPEEHLYFRDSSYFNRREENGKKIFWSRGNGWVMAGLARVLSAMPGPDPRRPFYENQFKEMAAKIVSLQQDDGLWRPSLLDPGSYPLKESSGSGFYTFALAWGINHGLLDRATFEPAVRKGWKGLVSCVTPEGRLEHVQPVGADPKKFDPTYNDVFGTGAFLLAGSEMYRLSGGTVKTLTR